MNNLYQKLMMNVQGGVNRATSVLRGAPTVAVVEDTAANGDAAAIALEPWRPLPFIDAEDFKATGKPFQANEWVAIAEFKMPPGTSFRIKQGTQYRFFVRGVKRLAGANAAAASRTRAAPGIIQTRQTSPAFPTLYHPDVQVWFKVGTVWSLAAVTAIDYDLRTVTYNEPANATDVEVRYVTDLGEWRLKTTRSLGFSDNQDSTDVNSSFSATHSVDQNSNKTAGKYPRTTVLVPGQRYVLEVKSSEEIDFSSRSGHLIQIRAETRQIIVTDQARLARFAEIEARVGV